MNHWWVHLNVGILCHKETKIIKKFICEKKILTVMVSNSTNISKTNNPFSPQPTEHKNVFV